MKVKPRKPVSVPASSPSGKPYRTLYAFDPVRSAILLLGGDKTGDGRWYEKNVPLADDLYDDHIEQLRKEGLING